MEYFCKWPFLPAPIMTFGLKIENITSYEWEIVKLKHHGYYKVEGNITLIFDVVFDLCTQLGRSCIGSVLITKKTSYANNLTRSHTLSN